MGQGGYWRGRRSLGGRGMGGLSWRIGEMCLWVLGWDGWEFLFWFWMLWRIPSMYMKMKSRVDDWVVDSELYFKREYLPTLPESEQHWISNA